VFNLGGIVLLFHILRFLKRFLQFTAHVFLQLARRSTDSNMNIISVEDFKLLREMKKRVCSCSTPTSTDNLTCSSCEKPFVNKLGSLICQCLKTHIQHAEMRAPIGSKCCKCKICNLEFIFIILTQYYSILQKYNGSLEAANVNYWEEELTFQKLSLQ
jgi:hypothetical protein